jgi:hypothetical protein
LRFGMRNFGVKKKKKDLMIILMIHVKNFLTNYLITYKILNALNICDNKCHRSQEDEMRKQGIGNIIRRLKKRGKCPMIIKTTHIDNSEFGDNDENDLVIVHFKSKKKRKLEPGRSVECYCGF